MGSAPARGYRRFWDIAGRLYIKDTGDPKRLLSLVWQAHDDLYNTLSKDDTLAGAACAAQVTRFGYDMDTFAEHGGALWAVVEFGVTAEEF